MRPLCKEAKNDFSLPEVTDTLLLSQYIVSQCDLSRKGYQCHVKVIAIEIHYNVQRSRLPKMPVWGRVMRNISSAEE